MTNTKTVGMLFVLILVIGAITTFMSRAGQVVNSDGVLVRYNAHAEGHGAEAEFARDCFGKNGTVAKFKQGDRYARLCVFEDGWVALQILAFTGTKVMLRRCWPKAGRLISNFRIIMRWN